MQASVANRAPHVYLQSYSYLFALKPWRQLEHSSLLFDCKLCPNLHLYSSSEDMSSFQSVDYALLKSLIFEVTGSLATSIDQTYRG